MLSILPEVKYLSNIPNKWWSEARVQIQAAWLQSPDYAAGIIILTNWIGSQSKTFIMPVSKG